MLAANRCESVLCYDVRTLAEIFSQTSATLAGLAFAALIVVLTFGYTRTSGRMRRRLDATASALSLALLTLTLCSLLYANVAAEDYMSGRAATGILFADATFACATINLFFIMIVMFDQVHLDYSARIFRHITSGVTVFLFGLLATDVTAMKVVNAAYGQGFATYYEFLVVPLGGIVGLIFGRRVNRSLRRHDKKVPLVCFIVSVFCVFAYLFVVTRGPNYTIPVGASVVVMTIAAVAAGALVFFLQRTR